MDILDNPLPPSAQDGNQPATDPVQPCPKKPVTVTITMDSTVACPGHKMQVRATGTPAGGTYQWTVSGADARLLDASDHPTATGDLVYFLSFHPDDAHGNIPHEEAKINVTYTCPDGEATTSADVTVHGIDFEVINDFVSGSGTSANELDKWLWVGNAGVLHQSLEATMCYLDLQAKIKVEKICPRMSACVGNHRIGWLQTLTHNVRTARYQERLVSDVMKVKLPVRDKAEIKPDPNDPEQVERPPFYGFNQLFKFNDQFTLARHLDSPSMAAFWTIVDFGPDQKAGKYTQFLRKVRFANSFNAWLVVQSVEQYERHASEASFVYLRNMDWSLDMEINVDMARPLGERCTPKLSPPTVSALRVGKGSAHPVLGGLTPKDEGAREETNKLVSPKL